MLGFQFFIAWVEVTLHLWSRLSREMIRETVREGSIRKRFRGRDSGGLACTRKKALERKPTCPRGGLILVFYMSEPSAAQSGEPARPVGTHRKNRETDLKLSVFISRFAQQGKDGSGPGGRLIRRKNDSGHRRDERR